MTDLKFSFNLPQLLVEMDTLENKLGSLDTTFKKIERAGKESFESIGDVATVANSNTSDYIEKAQQLAKAQEMSAKQSTVLRNALAAVSDEVNIGGNSVSGLVGQFKQKVSVLRAVTSALAGGSGALKVFRLALISTGIGALLVALGSLVALVTKNQKAMDFISKVMAGFGAVVNVVIDRLVALAAPIGKVVESIYNMGKAVALFVAGDFAGAVDASRKSTDLFKEATQGAKEALSGMGDEMAREAKLAYELEGNLQKITRAQQLLNIQAAGSRADIANLKAISENTNQAYSKRIGAAQKAYAIEQSLLNKQLDNQRQLIANSLGQTEYNEKTAKFINALKTGAIEFDEALKQIGLSDTVAEDFKAVEDQLVDLFNTEQESLEKQVEINSQLNSIRKEAADQAKAQKEAEKKQIDDLLKKYEDLTGALTENATAIGDEQATAEEKIYRVRDRSLAQLDEMRQSLNDLTVKLKAKGQVVGFNTDEVIEGIKDFINIEAEREIQNAKFPELPVKLDVKPIVGRIVEVNTELGIQFDDTKAKESFLKKADEVFKSFNATQKKNQQAGDFNFYRDVLGLDPEKNKDEIEGVKAAANEIIGVINQISQARLEAANLEVEEADKKVEARRKALDTEIAIAQLGFASNVDLRQKELADAEKAQAKALEQQKKAQKQQLLIDTLTQSVALITSSANIFKSLSPIPFVGVPLAIGVIATMFAAFAKVKADAFKAAKFGDGGEGYINSDGIVVGRSHRGGGVPIEVEGGELFRTDGRRFVVVKKTMTEKHVDLARAMNADDTASIARIAMDMALAEGVRFSNSQLDVSRYTDERKPGVNVTVNGSDNKETNRLLKAQLDKMDKEEKWSDSTGVYHRIGSVTYKTQNT